MLKRFQELLALLKIHFEYEESLMKDTKFGGYYSHKLEHNRFYKKIETLKHNLEKQDLLLIFDELSNMKNWFHDQIKISDKKCGGHFVAMGIK